MTLTSNGGIIKIHVVGVCMPRSLQAGKGKIVFALLGEHPSFEEVADKLQAMQDLVTTIGSIVSGKRAASRSTVLRVKSMHTSDLTIQAAITSDAKQQRLGLDEYDFVNRTASLLNKVGRGIATRSPAAVRIAIPSDSNRQKVLTKFERLISNAKNGPILSMKAGVSRKEYKFDSKSLEFVRSQVGIPKPCVERSLERPLTGKLIRIDIRPKQLSITVSVQGKELAGPLPDDFGAILQDISVGELVEVSALVEVDSKYYTKKIIQIRDIKPVQVPQLQMERIIWGERQWDLTDLLVVTPEFREDCWYYRSDYFGINAYGETRRWAKESFYEEFAFLYDEYALENNDNLTLDAIELKQRLLAIVDTVSEVA